MKFLVLWSLEIKLPLAEMQENASVVRDLRRKG